MICDETNEMEMMLLPFQAVCVCFFFLLFSLALFGAAITFEKRWQVNTFENKRLNNEEVKDVKDLEHVSYWFCINLRKC